MRKGSFPHDPCARPHRYYSKPNTAQHPGSKQALLCMPTWVARLARLGVCQRLQGQLRGRVHGGQRLVVHPSLAATRSAHVMLNASKGMPNCTCGRRTSASGCGLKATEPGCSL